MLGLGDMAGYAQVSLTRQDCVVYPLGYMTAGRPTPGQVNVYVFRMCSGGWLRVTCLAVDLRPVMICVAALADRLC